MNETRTDRLAALDHAHVWHPFTPMRQWREADPVIIEAGEGDELIDTRGRRYIDGVSSLWCNVHGHRVPEIDEAIRDQLGRVAHSTMLGLTNVPAVELAARLCEIAPKAAGRPPLNKVFYSDAGATATELAFKMAVGYWHHRGQPQRHTLLGLEGAYHGDTAGSMSVGYSDLFHRPFRKLTFHVETVPTPHSFRPSAPGSAGGSDAHPDDSATMALDALDRALTEKGDTVAAVVIEPLVQGAAGMVMQPPGYLAGVAELARKHGTLLIADEVATGFGRTGRMFACEHEDVAPDLLCLGKGLTGGYLPVAATLATDEIEHAFTGEIDEHRTLYHGHTFTGNPLGCAAALASLDLFEKNDLLADVNRKAALLAEWLSPLKDADRFPHVAEIRQCGLMLGIELDPTGPGGFDPSRPLGKAACDFARTRGVIIRPLGNTLILMPPLAIRDENLKRLADVAVEAIERIRD